jgi:hypothetical protein
MLNPKELRIGNLVSDIRYNRDGKIIVNGVITINANILSLLEASHLSHLKGIDLDAIWLQRCGFRKINEPFTDWKNEYQENGQSWIWGGTIWQFHCNEEGRPLYSNMEIKTVHQLQNLWYAIRGGDELKINY